MVSSTDQLNHALANAKPGDHIVLADGDYSAPTAITRSGTVENPIVVRAANILQANITSGDVIIDADNIIIQGLDFVGRALRAGVDARAANLRVWRCRFRNNSSENFAIRLYNCPDPDIAYCEVGSWLGRGFGHSYLRGTRRTVWRHSMFRDSRSGFRSGDGEAMHWGFDNPDDEMEGFIYRCKFKNWNGDAEVISIKNSGNTIRQCSIEGCDGAINNRFGGRNTYDACWSKGSWGKGHLPGAMHLCKGILERDVEAAIPDHGAAIVLYCGGGFRSALAADNLQKMGYTGVVSMDGGWRGWSEAGYPVQRPSAT